MGFIPIYFFNLEDLMSDKRVIEYCRESRDDNGEYSERIETQRDILVDFCNNHNLTNIIEIVMDDNVSGTKFDRLNDIVEKIKNKAVDVLVFKDASRLGRNLLESLKFVELANEYGVEILFESEKYSEEFFPLFAWFNEQRAREDSNKIRRVMQHKMENGELVIKSIYGYKKVGNSLVVDPDTAPIVKRIFEMYINGKGTREIATLLNYENIPTPSEHHKLKNVSNIWIQQQVYRIINNSVYTGDMIYRKTQKKSFKSKTATTTPLSQRIVVENHHEAIISKEMFAQAQSVKSQFKQKTTKKLSIFSGLIECGRCGRPLVMKRRKRYGNYYECIKYHQEGTIKQHIKSNYGCISHRISEKNIVDIILQYLNFIVQSKSLGERAVNEDSDNIKNSINLYQKEISKLEGIIEKIYDDRLNGLIDEKLYQKKSKEYNERIEKLKTELEDTKQMLSEEKIDVEQINNIVCKINEDDIDNFKLKQIFRKMIYFLPNEITQEHKKKYYIPDSYYEKLKNGGMYILRRYN